MCVCGGSVSFVIRTKESVHRKTRVRTCKNTINVLFGEHAINHRALESICGRVVDWLSQTNAPPLRKRISLKNMSAQKSAHKVEQVHS